MTKVAILGAGPTALMAAAAVERNGHEPIIFALPTPSLVNEDMFIQKPLPGWCEEPDVQINYMQWGEGWRYAQRVYGQPAARTSWDDLETGKHPGWWLAPLYRRLWDHFLGECPPDTRVTPEAAAAIARSYPVTINTLPANVICQRPGQHEFWSKETWLVRYRREDDRRSPQEIVYNGKDTPQWFRMTKLGPWVTWEYADTPPPEELSGESLLLPGRKFLANNCDCHGNIHRVGRWAKWQRGVLNHHAFEHTTGILAGSGIGKGA